MIEINTRIPKEPGHYLYFFTGGRAVSATVVLVDDRGDVFTLEENGGRAHYQQRERPLFCLNVPVRLNYQEGERLEKRGFLKPTDAEAAMSRRWRDYWPWRTFWGARRNG